MSNPFEFDKAMSVLSTAKPIMDTMSNKQTITFDDVYNWNKWISDDGPGQLAEQLELALNYIRMEANTEDRRLNDSVKDTE